MTEEIKDRDKIAYMLFFPYIIFFVLYVGLGYFYGISGVLPNISHKVRLLIVAGVVVTVYFFVRHTGQSLYQARRSGARDRLTWIGLFLILFVFSGCGFLASSMLIFEGPAVIREQVAIMTDAWGNLAVAGRRVLAVPEFEALKSRVEKNKALLIAEINTPGRNKYCGVGAKAKGFIALIAADIPGYQQISGTDQDHNCRDVENLAIIAHAYEDSVERGLAALPLSLKYRMPERTQFLSELDQDAKNEIDRLDALNTALGGVAVYIGGIAQYQEAVRLLEDAASRYAVDYKKLLDLSGESTLPLPSHVDVTAAERIASIPAMPSNIAHRLDHPTTWIYLIFAITLDLLAAYAASSVIMVHRRSEYGLSREEKGGRVGGPASDVASLWRPRENPSSSR